MSCKLKSEILDGFKDQKLTKDQLDAIAKAIDLLTSVPKVIKTTKGSVYYHTTDEDWNPKDLKVDNELGFHVGTLEVAKDYRKQALNKKVPNYLMMFEATKDLNIVRLTDTTAELGGWDVDNVKKELSDLGITTNGKTLQDVQQELVEMGYDAIEYVNKAELNDGTVNSLIVMNPKAIKSIGKDEILDDEMIMLGSEEDVYTQLGDRFAGADKAYFNRKNEYRNKVVKEYKDKLVGTRVGVLDTETNKMVFGEVRAVVRTLDTYIDLVFKDRIVTVDPETGMTVDGFSRVDGWETSPMYRGSQAKTGVFNEEYDLGSPTAIEHMQDLVDELNALDPDAVDAKQVDEYKQFIGQMDIEAFGKLRVTLDTEADSTLGRYTNNKISIRIGKFKQLAGNTMSAAEVYVHELVHAYTAFALRGEAAKTGNIKRRLRYLRDRLAEGNDWRMFLPAKSYDPVAEKANAEAKWKYIFENSSDGALDEFVAHVLTHPVLVEKAKNTVVQEQKVKNTLFDMAVDLFGKLMDIVSGRFGMFKKDKTVHEDVLGLMRALGAINNAAVVEKNERRSVLQVAFSLLNMADDKLSALMTEAVEKLGKKIPYKAMPKKPTKLEALKWMVTSLPQIASKPELRGAFETALATLWAKEEGTLQNIIRDFRTPDELEREIDDRIMKSGKIDRIRQDMVKATQRLVADGFSRKLTKEESTALTEIVLETDLQSVLDKYTVSELAELMNDDGKLAKEISNLKNAIKTHKDGTLFVNQAVALGMYMATGAVNEAMVMNVDSIVKDSTTKEQTSAVNALATLVAIDKSNKRNRYIVAGLLRSEAKGVDNVMAIHKGFIEQSKELLFAGSGALMQKGYTKEIFDDSVETKIAPTSDKEAMEKAGYELVYELGTSQLRIGKSGLAMYKSKGFGRQEYYRAATRMTGMASRGTTITDIAYAQDPQLGGDLARLAKTQLEVRRLKLLNEMKTRELTIDELRGEVAPLYNDSGEVMDYRYVMNKDNKKQVLDQDKDVSKVLGRSNGSVYDKHSTQKHNKAMLRLMFADMDENYVGGELGKNDSRYIEIGENSIDEVGQEIWKILPKEMKDSIKSRKQSKGKLFVKRSMLLNYFGFRHLSLLDSRLAKMLPKVLQTALKIAEDLWIAIVKISKLDVLIKTPVVVAMNIVSNVLFAVLTGTDPVTVLKMYIDSGRDIREYMNKLTEYNTLKEAMLSGNKLRLDVHKMKRLKKDLEDNPIHELMELGIYESVSEDLIDGDEISRNVVSKWISQKTERMPEWAQTTWNWLALNEKTSYYKNMEMMLRMGDLLAQAVQNKKMKLINEQKLTAYKKTAKSAEDVIKYKATLDKERIDGLVYDYVFYSKPASGFEEYLNRIGAIMFTKYAKRIQRVIGAAVTKHPLKATILGGLDASIGDSLPQVLDQTIVDRNWYIYGINPLTHLEKLIPPMVRLAV